MRCSKVIKKFIYSLSVGKALIFSNNRKNSRRASTGKPSLYESINAKPHLYELLTAHLSCTPTFNYIIVHESKERGGAQLISLKIIIVFIKDYRQNLSKTNCS